MKQRVWALALASAMCVSAVAAPAKVVQQADYIVAVVNSEPVTNAEVAAALKRVVQNGAKPSDKAGMEVLKAKVLNRLISERAQLQLARELGMKVEDAAVDQAEQSIAAQAQLDVTEWRKRMAKEGTDPKLVREQLRDQLLLQRLVEREVESRVRVSDADVESYIADKQANNTDPFQQEINLAQILVAVPEKASAEETARLYVQAQKVLQRIRSGEDFDRLVKELSAGDRSNGGQMGLRRADRYPALFVTGTQSLAVGEVSEVVKSGAGFHILKLVEKRAPTTWTQSIAQTRARHILLRLTPSLTQAAALNRLADYRKRIVSGKATFQSLAREFSQDGSAEAGGDLGWANPGMFVPEFEEVMSRLDEGQLSEPMVSRFGAHLIQVVERRTVDLPPRELREYVRAQLRAKRTEEAFEVWARDVRGRAFIEMREAPQ